MCGLAVACCRAGGTECSSACMGPFEEGRHYLHYLHHSLASGQKTGREHSLSTENWIKDLLNIALSIRTKHSFPLSQLSPIKKLPSASHPSPSEGRQNENHKHRKLTNLITWTTALSNSMKL